MCCSFFSGKTTYADGDGQRISRICFLINLAQTIGDKITHHLKVEKKEQNIFIHILFNLDTDIGSTRKCTRTIKHFYLYKTTLENTMMVAPHRPRVIRASEPEPINVTPSLQIQMSTIIIFIIYKLSSSLQSSLI